MTLSLGGELFFLFLSLLFGGAASLAVCLVTLAVCFVRGEDGRGNARVTSLKRPPFPFAPRQGKKEKQRRKSGKGKRFFLMLLRGCLDLLFFLLLSVLYSVFLYAAHDGVPRLYSLCAVAVGYFSFRSFLAPHLVTLAMRLLLPVRELAACLLLWGIYPLCLTLRGIFFYTRLLFVKIRVPFSRLCGILTKKIRKKREARLLARRMKEKEKRRAVGRVLTAGVTHGTAVKAWGAPSSRKGSS